MRIQGRQLRAANLAERRVLKSLGIDVLRVPRKLNPFAVARHIRKLAAGTGGNLPELRALVKPPVPKSPVVTEIADTPVIPTLPDSTSKPREAHAT